MRTRWILASTILISSCAMVKTTSLGTTLILKPQIQAGAYSTKTVVNPYTQASINHLILKLYTYDGTEHDQSIQKSIPNADLGKTVAFANLKTNITYRIKAYAYLTGDESQLISTSDANSYTDVTLVNDDHPAIAPLKVKLINIAFNGQGTGSLQITNGGYNYASSESLTVPTIVSTLAGGAGTTTAGFANGLGTAAQFNLPSGIAVDNAGNVYIADTSNHLIRKIMSNGTVSTLAGQAATAGYADGTGTAAKFHSPYGLTVDSAGNVYVADTANQLIRKITSDGVVSTLAGQFNASGYADGTGTAAKFNTPYGIAADAAGNVYVGDYNNNLVRKIASNGAVSTFAGGAGATAFGYLDGQGTAAKFNRPFGLAVDGAGNVYVADFVNYLIRKITSGGMVSTLAGGSGSTVGGYADGTGTAAQFNNAYGVAADGLGNLYVADEYNRIIRKITSTGIVSTFAGLPHTIGYADGISTAALFNNPFGVAADSTGRVYVADTSNNLIRVIK